MAKNLSVRIPDKLDLALERVAKKEERNKSFFVRKALENFLENYRDYKLARDEYSKFLASGKKGTDLKNLAKELGLTIQHYK